MEVSGQVLSHVYLWLGSLPGRFIPEEAPHTHSIGGWVGNRTGLHDVERWKVLSPSTVDRSEK
jgi:hypothetical protein